jgi:hypothetical protein
MVVFISVQPPHHFLLNLLLFYHRKATTSVQFRQKHVIPRQNNGIPRQKHGIPRQKPGIPRQKHVIPRIRVTRSSGITTAILSVECLKDISACSIGASNSRPRISARRSFCCFRCFHRNPCRLRRPLHATASTLGVDPSSVHKVRKQRVQDQLDLAPLLLLS